MMAASSVSRKTMKNMGTEKRFFPIFYAVLGAREGGGRAQESGRCERSINEYV